MQNVGRHFGDLINYMGALGIEGPNISMEEKITPFIVFWSFSNILTAQRISGVDFHQGRSEPMAGITISLLNSTGAEYQTSTDSVGNYEFKKVQSGVYSIKISGFTISDTVYNPVSISGDTTIKMVYSVCFKYDKCANDKKCPVCKMDDKVIPIHYGLIGGAVLKKGKHTLRNRKQVIDEFFPGGCVVTACDPNWHCKRDQLEF